MTNSLTGERHELPPYSLTVDGAVRYTGMTRTRIEGLLRTEEIKAVRTGRRTLILAESLRAYIGSLPSAR